MTVSSHHQRNVEQSLALLRDLKGAVGEFVAKETKLNEERREKASYADSQFAAASEEKATQLAAELERAEALLRRKQDLLRAGYQKRDRRLRKAHQNSKKTVLDRVELEEGRQKYELQKNLLETERCRQADLAANDAYYAELKGKLAEADEAFLELEKKTQRAFRGYGSVRQFMAPVGDAEVPGFTRGEQEPLQELHQLRTQAEAALHRFRTFLLPRVFSVFPAWLLTVLLVAGHAAVVPALSYFGVQAVTYQEAAISMCVLLVLLWLGFFAGKRQALPLATTIAGALQRADRLHQTCVEQFAAHQRQRAEQIEGEARHRTDLLNEKWDQTVAEAKAQRDSWPKWIDEKAARLAAQHEQSHQRKLVQLQEQHAQAVEDLKQRATGRDRELAGTREIQMTRLQETLEVRWQELSAAWQTRIQPIWNAIQAAQADAQERFPEWREELWQHWTPPDTFQNAVKIGQLMVDVEKFCEGIPQGEHLALPGPRTLSVPLLLTYPDQGSVLFETKTTGNDLVAGALNNILLRLLSNSPPGRVSFTIIDPVKLGQNFAGIMHLADYEENLINSRIWTQTGEIEQKLADLNEHMEKVIQMYLRNEYKTIAEYNEQAGNIAEKYHFLVVADFPVNFSETAFRRLVNIAASGARCGVYTLIHWDRRQALPQDVVLDELRKSSVCVTGTGNDFALAGTFLSGTRLVLDGPPPPELATDFLHKVGLSSRDSNRVEVPFSQVVIQEAQQWTLETTDELKIPIGRTGATKLQYLALGKGTRQHALIAGKTGSGKSTLFHIIITNLALSCSPEQVEFYLVDFKKGVEFKCYATRRLPQARVVAIESDREFGYSVLQRVDEELKRRGDLFRKLGVQDIPGYKRAGGTEPIPRSLLIIDEFQEFFVEDDRISQGAAVLLDRIVRQGRAFGIHVLLGSQTLGGAYTLARTTIGQMVIRIALQCNEADAYLIMDDNNPAPRLLSRPGEGIYNDMAGALEGNSPFQAVWLPDEERERCLDAVRARADRSPIAYPGPFVFEGNAPADVRENAALQTLLQTPPNRPPGSARIWLGAPNAIKGPTEAVFHRQSGSNLLLIGQQDEAIRAILSIALLSLAAQYPPQTVRFMFFESAPPGSAPREFLQRIARVLPCEIHLGKSGDLAVDLRLLADEMKRRSDGEQAGEVPAVFLFVHGLHHFKKLRQEEDFGFSLNEGETEAKPAALLHELICEGPGLGIHVIASCDTYNNVNRFLARKALSEFEMRVLFQMSANDSASLIDSPKATTLGLHRGLFYNEHEGYLETFRPYALPRIQWMEEAGRKLAQRTDLSPTG